MTTAAPFAAFGDHERVRFVNEGAHAIFLLDDRPAWIIDPDAFSGSPHLSVRESANDIEIEMRGGRFPGSRIPADFRALCTRRGKRWSIDLAFDFLEFRASGALDPWLSGDAALTSSFQTGELTMSDDGPLALSLGGGEASFDPRFAFEIRGAANRLFADGISLAFERLRFALGRSRRFALRQSAMRCSAVDLDRGTSQWDILPAVPDSPFGTIESPSPAFTEWHALFEESQYGITRASIEALAPAGIAYAPGQALRNPRGGPALLPLRDARLVAAFSRGRTEKAFVASLASETKLLVDDVVLTLDDRTDTRAFELLHDASGDVCLTCAPTLVAALASIDGDFLLPVRPLAATAIPITSVATGSTSASGICVATDAATACMTDCILSVTRPVDALELSFELHNLSLTKRTGTIATLDRCGTGTPTLIVHFPPQAIGERAYLDPDEQPAAPPVPARLSGTSRLAFTFPAEFKSAPLTMETLLAWDRLTPVTVDAVREHDRIKVPSDDVTAIELPYRLILTPEATTSWQHSASAVVRHGRAELWHTRAIASGASHAPLHAIWSRDFVTGGMPLASNEEPFRMSLKQFDRQQIVLLSHDKSTGPAPALASLLMLSSLGAWADIEALWPWTANRDSFRVEKWTHVMTQGRDQHVVVMYRGYLYPFGHRALLVKETNRLIRNSIAYLIQKKYILVKEPTRTYETPDLPFVRFTIVDRQTPTLDDLSGKSIPNCTTGAANDDETVFWPRVKGAPFAFSLVGTDRAGNNTTFRAPLIFVSAAEKDRYSKDAQCAYAGAGGQRRSDLAAQTVALASSQVKGDTEVEALAVDFEGVLLPASDDPRDEAPFRPIVEQIQARVPAVDQMLDGRGGAAWMRLRNPDTNEAGIFAELVTKGDIKASFEGSAQRSGGVATPAVAVSHLSRRFGPVGASTVTSTDASAPPAFTFEPSTFFSEEAKILGSISLTSIIAALPIEIPDQIPALLSLRDAWTDGPDRIVQKLHWETDNIKDVELPFLAFKAKGNSKRRLMLDSTVELLLADKIDAAFTVRGSLRNFALHLNLGPAGGIILSFNGIEFSSGSRIPMDVQVDFDTVDFTGALSFVKELANKIDFGGVAIEVAPTGVTVVPPPITIPDFEAGAFALENLLIESRCHVPFISRPVEFQFDFGRRDRPFLVTVGQFSGGGFMSLSVDANDGLKSLSASFEFGAVKNVQLSGIASGTLFVFGGLYYRVSGKGSANVDFYVRAGGVLNALGFITLAVDLYLSLRYANGSFSGTAWLTHSFEIGFIKQSFTVSYSQTFSSGGVSESRNLRSPSDPIALSFAADLIEEAHPAATAPTPARKVQFADTMPIEEWALYWNAFRA